MYGPITSWLQWVANYLGGENMHDIVFWLQVITVVPFIIACAGIVQLAHGDKRAAGPGGPADACATRCSSGPSWPPPTTRRCR